MISCVRQEAFHPFFARGRALGIEYEARGDNEPNAVANLIENVYQTLSHLREVDLITLAIVSGKHG